MVSKMNLKHIYAVEVMFRFVANLFFLASLRIKISRDFGP
uniref:Uncharacterized protein n=1 Tax=Parascaris equorum TaxID=6256 RepID=A0A914R9D8_PAREQ